MAVTLEDLKARMTEEQRRDMAEIVANEVKRRESMKTVPKNYGPRPAAKSNVRSSKMSNALPADALGEMYADVRSKVTDLRRKQIDQQLAETRALARRTGTRTGSLMLSKLLNVKTLLVLGVVSLGLLKMGYATGVLGSKSETLQATPSAETLQQATVLETPAQVPVTSAAAIVPAAAPIEEHAGSWTPSEKQVLTELDTRRVELEKRRQELDRRESEIEAQGQALAERIAELRTLVTKVSQVRKERDNQYEARLEQLANVYGSMAPNEAAPLVGKLDEETSIALLKRMPGKRMGQILSLMEPERAVHLTQVLSEKGSLDEVPAK